MITSNDWIKHFPYSEIRPQQNEAIEFALNAFGADKKFVVIEASTGIGKSAIGYTINKTLLSPAGTVYRKTGEYLSGGYFLTTQKILQEQYVNDFQTITSLKSSSNYQCKFHKKNSCAESLRSLSGVDKSSKFFKTCAFGCVYKKAKEDFIKSKEGITNFAYFLAETQYAKKIKPRQLLIIDEAHNIELQLSKFIELTISERFAKSILKLEWPDEMTLSKSVKWVSECYLPKLKKHLKFVKSSIEKYIGMAERINEFASLAKKLDMLDKHKCKIERFLEIYRPDNWIVNRQKAYGKASEKIEFKAIDVSHFANDMLFYMGGRVLLMSATILDRNAFCESLGIPIDDVEFVSYPSPFPIENRPIMFNPIGSMASRTIDESLPKMAKAVKAILSEHKNDKGVIHCHSYRIANYLKKNIRSTRLLIHDSSNRDQILDKHINGSKNTVLLSPSMTEGVDLKDDSSRFQILCKVPYPYLGDKLVKKRMHKWKWWYPLQTAKTIVQSVGRSIRHKEDFAVTYILDSDFERFYGRNKKYFPVDFKQTLI